VEPGTRNLELGGATPPGRDRADVWMMDSGEISAEELVAEDPGAARELLAALRAEKEELAARVIPGLEWELSAEEMRRMVALEVAIDGLERALDNAGREA
jgi:hypothetical protein